MPRFAANLTMLFTEEDFPDRFKAAADAGFKGVEYLFPYAYDASDLAASLQEHDLTQVLHNLPAGDWEAGERGIAVMADRTAEFREGVDKAIHYAKTLGCPQVNCLAGITPEGADPETLTQTFVENLKFAADRLGAEGIRLLIEPINTQDIPGFFLSRTDQAVDIIERVGSDNLYLQYDAYHMQIMEGNLSGTIKANLARIAHIQLADTPGRHEPGTGEINYPFLFGFLDDIGYDGWIGCEYKPLTTTVDGLGWFADYAASVQAAA